MNLESLFFQVEDKINNTFAVGASVNIVAQAVNLVFFADAYFFAHQFLECFTTSVNIADNEGSFHKEKGLRILELKFG